MHLKCPSFILLFQLTIVPKTVCGRENLTKAGAEDLSAKLLKSLVSEDEISCTITTSHVYSQYYALPSNFCRDLDNGFF